MARIDRAALNRAEFPVTMRIPTRFADLDLQSHVNNAAVAVILQESRVSFNRTVDLPVIIDGLRTLVAGITIEYAAELTYPGELQIASGITRLGRTSFTIQQVIRQNGNAAIYAETTLVMADDAGPAPIPDRLRDNLNRFVLKLGDVESQVDD